MSKKPAASNQVAKSEVPTKGAKPRAGKKTHNRTPPTAGKNPPPPPGPHEGAGAPQDPDKQYRAQYAEDIIEHLKSGDPFEAFGAYLGDKYGKTFAVGRTRLYEWLKDHQDFKDAREIGESYAMRFWYGAGKQGTLGMLRRVAEERVVVNPETGQPVVGPDGKPLTHKKFAPAAFAQNSWRMIMASRFGLYDQKKLEHTGEGGGPIKTQEIPLSKKEKLQEIKNRLGQLDEIGDEDDLEE